MATVYTKVVKVKPLSHKDIKSQLRKAYHREFHPAKTTGGGGKKRKRGAVQWTGKVRN